MSGDYDDCLDETSYHKLIAEIQWYYHQLMYIVENTEGREREIAHNLMQIYGSVFEAVIFKKEIE